jgi:hypothetical protein
LLGTLTGYLANAFLSRQKVKPAPAGPGDARSQLEEIHRQLDEKRKRVTSERHARLGEIADSLR